MTKAIEDEIRALEERLRQAELGPDAQVFEQLLADACVIVGEDGTPGQAKAMVVEAHRPGKGPKFTRAELRDLKIIAHGETSAVVTCRGEFDGPRGSFALRFMRVWLRRPEGWQVIAGSVSKD